MSAPWTLPPGFIPPPANYLMHQTTLAYGTKAVVSKKLSLPIPMTPKTPEEKSFHKLLKDEYDAAELSGDTTVFSVPPLHQIPPTKLPSIRKREEIRDALYDFTAIRPRFPVSSSSSIPVPVPAVWPFTRSTLGKRKREEIGTTVAVEPKMKKQKEEDILRERFDKSIQVWDGTKSRILHGVRVTTHRVRRGHISYSNLRKYTRNETWYAEVTAAFSGWTMPTANVPPPAALPPLLPLNGNPLVTAGTANRRQLVRAGAVGQLQRRQPRSVPVPIPRPGPFLGWKPAEREGDPPVMIWDTPSGNRRPRQRKRVLRTGLTGLQGSRILVYEDKWWEKR